MRMFVTMMLCVCVLGAVVVPATAADPLTEQRRAQNKLLALRAARADAIRKLAERIKGLHITSTTSVKDFVTENDRIEAGMVAFLSGMREVGKPRYMEDLTCELTMEVTLKTVITTLKQLHRAHYRGTRVKINDFEKMTVTNKFTVIRETGSGAPREDEPPLVVPGPGESRASFTNVVPKIKAHWLKHCTGRGRLMAERAARMDGMRKLGERIKGVHITSETTVQDFVARSDQINVAMATFLKGAREIGTRYHDDELIVEVEMQVKLRTLYASLKSWGQAHYRGDRTTLRSLEKLSVRAEDKIIREIGMGVPPARYLRQPVSRAAMVEMRMAPKAPPWISQTVKATGDGAIDAANPNQASAKLMAFRAAEMDARRKLAEQIEGLMITSQTSVKDFVADNDQIRAEMLAFQQGAHVLEGSKRVNPDKTVQVDVEIELTPLWRRIVRIRKTTVTVNR